MCPLLYFILLWPSQTNIVTQFVTEFPVPHSKSPVITCYSCLMKRGKSLKKEYISLYNIEIFIIMTFPVFLPGWDRSWWSWCGLRLVPSAVLVRWQNSSSGRSGHPSLLCVVCVPLLPPRLLLALIGHILCSQVCLSVYKFSLIFESFRLIMFRQV